MLGAEPLGEGVGEDLPWTLSSLRSSRVTWGRGKASPRGRLPPFVRRGDPRLRGDDKSVAGMTSANKALFWALFRCIS